MRAGGLDQRGCPRLVHRHFLDQLVGREVREVVAGLHAALGELLREGLASLRKRLGNDHPHVPYAARQLAGLLYDTGRLDEAELLAREVTQAQKQLIGRQHTGLLMKILLKKGEFVEAEPMLREAVRRHRDRDDQNSLAHSLSGLGECLTGLGQYADAERLLTRALRIKEQILGEDHLDVALGLNNLATVYVSQGQYSQAAPLFQRALAIREARLGADHADVAKTLEEYAALLRKADQSAEAADLELRAKTIRAKLRSG